MLQYNGPLTIPWRRRNEVAVVVSEAEEEEQEVEEEEAVEEVQAGGVVSWRGRRGAARGRL